MSSSNGIVRNRDSLSIDLWYCATECSSNPAIWLPAQSTYGWLRFGDWRTRPPMLVYSARNWLQLESPRSVLGPHRFRHREARSEAGSLRDHQPDICCVMTFSVRT